MSGGEPINWTDEMVGALCGEIASGRAISELAGKDGFPSERAIYRKMSSDPKFAGIIAQARAAQQEYEADACVDMADKATAADWQVVKLRIWARQWRASKLAPKKYGDRMQLTGADGGAIRTVDEAALAKLEPHELDQLIAIRQKLEPSDTSGSSGGEGS